MAAPRSPGCAVRPRTLPEWPRAPLSVLSPSLEAQGPGPAGPRLRFWKAFPRGILARPGRDRDARAWKGPVVALSLSPSERRGPGGEQSTWIFASRCGILQTPASACSRLLQTHPQADRACVRRRPSGSPHSTPHGDPPRTALPRSRTRVRRSEESSSSDAPAVVPSASEWCNLQEGPEPPRREATHAHTW